MNNLVDSIFWFTSISTVMFLFFAIIWSTKDFPNVILKVAFAILAFGGSSIIWNLSELTFKCGG